MLFWQGFGRIAAIFAFIATTVSPSWAFEPKITAEQGTVRINSRDAVRFRVGNGELTPAERSEITASRLRQLVAAKLDPASIYVKGDKRQARILVGDSLLCMVTASDAQNAGTSAISLGSAWVARMRGLLEMPAIVLSVRELTIPLGESRRVEVGGAATGPITVMLNDAEVADALVGTDGRYITLTARKAGQTIARITVDGQSVGIPVEVRKYAGVMPVAVAAEVSGCPCPGDVIEYAVRRAALQSAILEPGSVLEVAGIQSDIRALLPGVATKVDVDIRISGPGYITFAGRVPVEVRNLNLPKEAPDQLFYSNAPERLLKYQRLFAGRIDPGKPTRILYHHQNAIGRRVHLIMDIVNPNTIPAKLRVIKGVSRPHIDTVLVGHIAGAEFLRNYSTGVSVVEVIPPHSRLALVSDVLEHNQTSSGILQVKEMEGGPVFIRVTALQPGVEASYPGSIAAAPNPLLIDLSDHVYPTPVRTVEADYVVGERWAFIPIGKHAIDDSQAQKKLYGNYGVTYNISVTVENPTDKTRKIRVAFDPSAGLASGVFYIDGKFVAMKYAKPPDEVTLSSFQLGPGKSRKVGITTVPLAGSNYPARLVVRS